MQGFLRFLYIFSFYLQKMMMTASVNAFSDICPLHRPNTHAWSVRARAGIKVSADTFEQLILTLTGHSPSCLGSVGRGGPS